MSMNWTEDFSFRDWVDDFVATLPGLEGETRGPGIVYGTSPTRKAAANASERKRKSSRKSMGKKQSNSEKAESVSQLRHEVTSGVI